MGDLLAGAQTLLAVLFQMTGKYKIVSFETFEAVMFFTPEVLPLCRHSQFLCPPGLQTAAKTLKSRILLSVQKNLINTHSAK